MTTRNGAVTAPHNPFDPDTDPIPGFLDPFDPDFGNPGLPAAILGFDLGAVGRLLLVLFATGALLLLAASLITVGLVSLLGLKPGDVAKLTPPGRAGTIAEFAVKG